MPTRFWPRRRFGDDIVEAKLMPTCFKLGEEFDIAAHARSGVRSYVTPAERHFKIIDPRDNRESIASRNLVPVPSAGNP